MQTENPAWHWTQATVLVVGDDPASRALLCRRLQRDGLKPLEAADGPAALQLLRQERIDGALLDIGLPGMSGLDVLRALRQTHAAEHLPVLIVTAFDEIQHLEAALQSGANDYVNKPIDYTTLRARLRVQLERAHDARALQALRERDALVLRATNDGVWEWDATTGALQHSANWFALLSWQNADGPQTLDGWMQRIHPDDAPEVRERFQTFVETATEHTLRLQYRLLGADDDYRWIETRGAAMRDAQGRCLRLAGTHTDISALQYVNRVTNLPNLQRLIDLLERHLRQLRANDVARVGILALQFWDLERQLDLDRSHSLGHAVEAISRAVNALLGDAVWLASGELSSQIVLLWRAPDIDLPALQATAQTLLSRFAQGVVLDHRVLRPMATVGLYGAPARTVQARQAPAAALLAARLARERDCKILVFDAAIEAAEERKKRLLSQLHEAIAQRRIVPWWQPIVDADGRLAGFEALARWIAADGKPVSPAEFIPLAQSAGLMPELTAQVLDASLAALARWRNDGRVGQQVYMAVNFPPTALLDRAFLPQIESATATHRLPCSALCIEVTESDAAGSADETERVAAALRARGFALAIDDFGTGYSSLSMLHRLAFDTVKIDQSFVRDMLDQPRQREMVRAIIGMAKALGMRLVAEGVETAQQADALRSEGVDRMQGYLYARPMPEKALCDWIVSRPR